MPRADYLAAILDDYVSARDNILRDPVYGVLTLCRVYRSLLDGAICSKEEAGVWATHHLPAILQPVAEGALGLYRGAQTDAPFAPTDLTAFAYYVNEHIGAWSARRTGDSDAMEEHDGEAPRLGADRTV